jgi:hypothetical protein
MAEGSEGAEISAARGPAVSERLPRITRLVQILVTIAPRKAAVAARPTLAVVDRMVALVRRTVVDPTAEANTASHNSWAATLVGPLT